MPSRVPLVLLVLAAGAAAIAAAPSRAAESVTATSAGREPVRVALPDTGLFAPVAAQLRAREARLAKTTNPGATRVGLLLATGRNDDAAREAAKLEGDDTPGLVARARAALAVQDFATATPLVDRLARVPDDDARSLHYRWLSIRDDAAAIDSLTRTRLTAPGASAPDFLAAARFAYDQFDYDRADSLYKRALAAVPAGDGEGRARLRAAGHLGRTIVLQKRRKWDDALAESRTALDAFASSEGLDALAQTLIQLGRTDEAISAAEWGVRLDPYHLSSHYTLGNGYARKNYSQLFTAFPASFAAVSDARALSDADRALHAGRREEARKAYERIIQADGRRVDARVRIASLDFEEGRFAESRDQCFVALATCPEYGRAHAVLAKALESQRFAIDVHRPEYERRFDAKPMPGVPGIERFVANWSALTPRHQKRVAISMAPWKNFIPVLVEGGATYYIKPLYELLSECPNLEPLRDTRIEYDSRLWDDVRGCGGYHTVTGIEDVERTIFDRYDTVVHELSHQVHGVMPADDVRAIQELYRKAKERDDVTKDGYLSRYAGGSVYEYFAEGANALVSPKRDAYDPREVVRERLLTMDPDLQHAVEGYLARTDVSGSYPVAYASGGGDRVYRGQVDEAIRMYEKALAIVPTEETALVGLANALVLANRAAAAESVAVRAVAAHGTSGPAHVARASAHWHATGDLAAARATLAAARVVVVAADRYQVDAALGTYAWTAGEAAPAQAAFDSVLAYQSDNPDGLRGRAAALALAGHAEEAVAQYDAAVRVRTGVVGLRNDFARDLLWAGKGDDATRQLDEAHLIDEQNPMAEALRGWAALEKGDLAAARKHVAQSLTWGEWCDFARIVDGGIALRAGDRAAAERAWQPVRARLASKAPPEFVYRPKISSWEEVHTLPAVERRLLERLGAGVP